MCSILIALVVLSVFVLSSKALPKARQAHERVVRAQISQRVYEIVDNVYKNVKAELLSQAVYDENGVLSHVELDLTSVNDICVSIVSELASSFEKHPTVSIGVPVGSVTGIKIFSGKGAEIYVPAYVYPSFSAKIESSIESAGINQTLHKLTLTVSCDIVSVCGDDTIEISEKYNFDLKQSLIIGSVPFA